MEKLQTNKLKEDIRKVYSSVKEVLEHHKARIAEAGNPIAYDDSIIVCLLRTPPVSDRLFIPSGVTDNSCQHSVAATFIKGDRLFIAQVPGYCGSVVAGMDDVKVLSVKDIICYWDTRTLEAWLK